MKKNILFGFIFSACINGQIISNETTQRSTSAESGTSIVQLTNEEKVICKKILSCPPCTNRLITVVTLELLKRHCAFKIRTIPTEYDTHKHPQCAEAIKYLVDFAAEQEKLDKKSEEFFKKINT